MNTLGVLRTFSWRSDPLPYSETWEELFLRESGCLRKLELANRNLEFIQSIITHEAREVQRISSIGAGGRPEYERPSRTESEQVHIHRGPSRLQVSRNQGNQLLEVWVPSASSHSELFVTP